MIFIPTSRIVDLMRVEAAGVWIERSTNDPKLWMVAKLPMNLIREIDAGAAVSLRVWVVELDGGMIPVFGFLVFDDAVHPYAVYGACRSTEEIDDLRTLLAMTSFPLQVHNENGLPLFHAVCKIAPDLAASVSHALPSGDYPSGDGVELRARALDVVAASLEPGSAPDPRIRASCVLPLGFEHTEKLQAHVIGSGTVTLTDTDEGNELERLTFQLFDSLFSFGAYHAPEIDDGAQRRELCDVLALSRVREFPQEGIFVIQNKVASAFSDGLKRTTERRSKSIQKNILKGIGQAVGAIKKLKAGVQVYCHRGAVIEADPPEVAAAVEALNLRQRANQVGHGIVLISDMHGGVEWQKVWETMLHAARETGYLFHVLDLRELQRMILHANGRPALLESYLVTRWNLMAEQKSALVRFDFKT